MDLPDDLAPDLIEPLRAWRVWSVPETDAGWRLSSIHYRQVWEPRSEAAAWCYRSSRIPHAGSAAHDRHLAPVAGCQCGIYGARRPEAAGEYLPLRHGPWESMYVSSEYRHRVVGEIELWGRTLECADGYRASFGYPARLWVPTRRPDGREFDAASVALGLADYGVPITLLDAGTRDEVLDEIAHGRLAPDRHDSRRRPASAPRASGRRA